MIDWYVELKPLSEVSPYVYFKKRGMPTFVEPLVTKFVDAIAASGSEWDRQGLFAAFDAKTADTFGWYARKLAGRCVRDESHTDLLRGLIALLVAAEQRGDSRDLLAPLALLYNSAHLLHEDADALFQEVSSMSTGRGRDFLQNFLKRPPSQQSISIFKFSEGAGPHGFDYVPLLPEFGGPTPF